MARNIIVDELLTFIAEQNPSDDAFNALALQIFAFQFQNNRPYASFVRSCGKTPSTVKRWWDIPPVPINAFKTLDLTCCPPATAAAVFMTSGTTQNGLRGRSYHAALEVYDASMRRHFAERFMRGDSHLPMGILFPDPEIMPNSSLAHYLDLAIKTFGTSDSEWLIGADGIDLPRLISALERAEATGESYALLGASFSFVHAIDALQEQGRRFHLPPGSRILDTGGFKGQSRDIELDAFYDALCHTFGVARSHCIGMYGMTELSSQFYDDGNLTCPSVKSGPHWMRSRVVNPLTGVSVPKGQTGVLAHTDLAHYNIVTTILTEDAAVEVDDGFLLLGRVEGAEAVGCSMAVDEFLKATAGC